MTNTERHALPQWEKDDRLLMEDFNRTMANIDAALPKIITGSYTGNGAASQTIPLSFTPKILFVADSGGRMGYQEDKLYTYGGLALEGKNSAGISIMENGFTVYYNISASPRQFTNVSNSTYYYLAIG